MTLFPNNWPTQCISFLIVELKSKLLNAQVLLFCIFLKSEKRYFHNSPANCLTYFDHLFILKF